MIAIDNLGFAYGDKRIYEGFSLNLHGRLIGLIGQNGAGKTTLVNLMLGILRPESGRITIDNLDVKQQRNEVLELVGVMFEHSEFPRWISLARYLSFVAQVRGMDSLTAKSEADRLLKKFDLWDYRDRNFQKLSAGMKQKFGIAQAIIGFPKYIFLDEPTANLDVKARMEVLEYLQQVVWEKDVTVIILSHILHDLERICDHVVFIHEGKLVMEDEMTNLLSMDYNREYSIRFRSVDEVQRMVEGLGELGIEITGKKGIVLEFRCKNEDLKRIRELIEDVPVAPTRSLLEQIFVDKVGGLTH